MNSFKTYQIKDVRILLSDLSTKENFHTKAFNRKFSDVHIIPPKDFEKYRENNYVKIAGRIRKRQRKYNDYAEQELANAKLKENIIGKCILKSDDKEKYYDVTESTGKHITGYAWVGQDLFLEVTSINFFFLLLPLLLALLIAVCLSSCPGELPSIDVVDGDPISSTNAPDIEQPPNVDLVTFPETTVLNENNKTIKLVNLESNAGNYYISYELYLDGEQLGADTGAIKPGEQLEVDLWTELNSGEYELKAVATSWDYETKQPMPVKNTLITTLAVEK